MGGIAKVGIIAGSGLSALESLSVDHREVVYTPYGKPSGTFQHSTFAGQKIVFLSRHGFGQSLPPHKINYRANLWALKQLGVNRIISLDVARSIGDTEPTKIAIPDQIIDYTYSREHTFFAEGDPLSAHLDFSYPYCSDLRERMLIAAKRLSIDCCPSGVYGVIQGPRFETVAETRRMRGDGCDFIGMSGMPEASLARELAIPYAACLVMIGWAAGVQTSVVKSSDTELNLLQGMASASKMIQSVVGNIDKEKNRDEL